MRKEGGPLVARSKAGQEKSPDTGTSARLTPGLTREATPLPLSESLLCIIMQRRCVIQGVCKCLMVIY